MKKKMIALLCAAVVGLGSMGMVGCAKKDNSFTIAYLAAGRGDTYVEALVEEFKKTDAWENYLAENELEDLEVKIIKGPTSTVAQDVENSINTGKYPDVMFFNYGMSGVRTTENLVSNEQLVNLDDLLDRTIPGETVKLKDKIVDGLLENFAVKPYGNERGVYTLPAFYSPTGLWYDASRFSADGLTPNTYKLPATWAEFWQLGNTLNEANNNNANVTEDAPSLFTYPTAGYFDGFIYSAVAGMAGEDKFMQMLSYADGIWNDAGVKSALEVVVKLRHYLEPNTVANANKESFSNNQQAVIGKVETVDGVITQKEKGTALFMPNGDWLPGEMEKSTPADFEWGFMPLPAKDAATKSYVNTFIENVYLHKEGDHTDLAKEFLLFYYSDVGAKIVAEESGAIIPTDSALAKAEENGVSSTTIDLYSVYDGNGAVSGTFATTETVTGLVWADILFNNLNDKVFNKKNIGTEDSVLLNNWITELEDASDQYRANIIN